MECDASIDSGGKCVYLENKKCLINKLFSFSLEFKIRPL